MDHQVMTSTQSSATPVLTQSEASQSETSQSEASQSKASQPDLAVTDRLLAVQKIAFIGGGNMAQAIIGGLLACGVLASQLIVSDPAETAREVLAQQGIGTTTDNTAAIIDADVVILAVKPQLLATVLGSLKGQFEQQLLVSIVAGAPIQTIRQLLGGYDKIVRVMPNTPALVLQGAHGLYADDDLPAAQRQIAAQILAATGLVKWVDDEAKIDAVTALSGSGPAYFFYLMEAMIQAGKNLGLDEQTATDLTLQTALGAAQMAVGSAHNPAQLRRQVTSPNGTTEAAINTFDQYQVAQHIQAALAAAQQRSQSLAEELKAAVQPRIH